VVLGAATWLAAEQPAELVPLNTLRTGTYRGFVGGLYADGRNEPWGAHAEALRGETAAVRPLDREGRPDPAGKIVVLGVGASVCNQIFAAIESLAPSTSGINPAVVFVNGARGGQDVNKIADPSGRYWTQAKATLTAKGLSPAQVQVAWYQSDDLRDQRDDFPGRPQRLKQSIAENLRLLRQHFPNVRICYHSARHTTALGVVEGAKDKHGEPRPYYVGWAVKWLIEEQVAGRDELRFAQSNAVMPLAAWAGYFWTAGDKTRDDGYRWTRDDVVADGVHLSDSAKVRVAGELLTFFRSDPYAKTWCATPQSTSVGAAAEKPPAAVSASQMQPAAALASPLPSAATSELPIRKSTHPDDPGWIVNGKDKIPKLQRLLITTENVRAVVSDLEGKQLAEIKDVFHKRTNLNSLLGPGQYQLQFFDKDNRPIKLSQEVAEILRLK
jgi:hypothetical protein